MTELHAEHVERKRVWGNRLSVLDESEAGMRIDEPRDQPGGRHPIDAGPWPGDPQAPSIVRGTFGPVLRLSCTPAPGVEPLGELLDQLHRAIAAGTAEEVRAFDRG